MGADLPALVVSGRPASELAETVPVALAHLLRSGGVPSVVLPVGNGSGPWGAVRTALAEAATP